MTTHTPNNFLGEVTVKDAEGRASPDELSNVKMTEKKLYPSIIEDTNVIPTAPPISKCIDKSIIQTERNKKILNDIKTLEEKYNHYNKVRKKWSKANTTANVISLIIGSSAAILTVVGTSGIIVIPLAITSIVGISGIAETILVQSVLIGMFNNKRKRYQQLSEEVNNTKSKLYVFHQKALDDGFIDNDEVIKIENILNNLNKNINKIKNKHIKIKSNTKLNNDEINKLKELLH